jgi:hypothetical protein
VRRVSRVDRVDAVEPSQRERRGRGLHADRLAPEEAPVVHGFHHVRISSGRERRVVHERRVTGLGPPDARSVAEYDDAFDLVLGCCPTEPDRERLRFGFDIGDARRQLDAGGIVAAGLWASPVVVPIRLPEGHDPAPNDQHPEQGARENDRSWSGHPAPAGAVDPLGGRGEFGTARPHRRLHVPLLPRMDDRDHPPATGHRIASAGSHAW